MARCHAEIIGVIVFVSGRGPVAVAVMAMMAAVVIVVRGGGERTGRLELRIRRYLFVERSCYDTCCVGTMCAAAGSLATGPDLPSSPPLPHRKHTPAVIDITITAHHHHHHV